MRTPTRSTATSPVMEKMSAPSPARSDRSRLGPEARAATTRRRRAPARRGCTAGRLRVRRKDITPVEAVVRPQYEAQFRQSNQTLISQVKPVR